MRDVASNPSDNTPTKDKPIVIAGGGLVGFSLALLLAQKGLKSILLEARTFPSATSNGTQQDNASHINTSYINLDSRNTALSRKSVQIYQQLGLWQQLKSHAAPVLEVQITEKGSFGKARLVAGEENVESFGQVMENRWLGHKLLEAARGHERITLLDGATISHLTQDEKVVYITYQQGGDEHRLTTPLMVAADGQHSFCRQALGVGVDAKDYEQTAVVAVVETDKPHANIAFERFGEHGPLALLPLAGKDAEDKTRRSVVWIAKTGTENQYIGEDNDAHFLATLQAAFGGRAGKFLRAGRRGAYPLAQVLADTQVMGRCVILGNAAHTLHPVAGQGFNLCLRDADVFTGYVSRYMQKQGDFSDFSKLHQTLKAYEAARLKDQKRVIRFCDGVVRGFTHANPVLRLSRNLGLLAFDTIPGAKQLVANYAMGLKG